VTGFCGVITPPAPPPSLHFNNTIKSTFHLRLKPLHFQCEHGASCNLRAVPLPSNRDSGTGSRKSAKAAIVKRNPYKWDRFAFTHSRMSLSTRFADGVDKDKGTRILLTGCRFFWPTSECWNRKDLGIKIRTWISGSSFTFENNIYQTRRSFIKSPVLSSIKHRRQLWTWPKVKIDTE